MICTIHRSIGVGSVLHASLPPSCCCWRFRLHGLNRPAECPVRPTPR